MIGVVSRVSAARTRTRSVAAGMLLLGGLLGTPQVVGAQAAPWCPAGQSPQFLFGFAALQQRLGALMGQPVECEHGNPQNNDTLQRTSTGLAYYRPAINTPIFTNGLDHYALTPAGLLHWRNASVEPPTPTPDEQAFLTATEPLQRQANSLVQQLVSMQQTADSNQLDTLDVADIGAILDDLTATRDAYGGIEAPPSLAPYASSNLDALNAAVAAAETMVRARIADNAAARQAFVVEAEADVSQRDQLLDEAMSRFSDVLPVTVG